MDHRHRSLSDLVHFVFSWPGSMHLLEKEEVLFQVSTPTYPFYTPIYPKIPPFMPFLPNNFLPILHPINPTVCYPFLCPLFPKKLPAPFIPSLPNRFLPNLAYHYHNLPYRLLPLLYPFYQKNTICPIYTLLILPSAPSFYTLSSLKYYLPSLYPLYPIYVPSLTSYLIFTLFYRTSDVSTKKLKEEDA